MKTWVSAAEVAEATGMSEVAVYNFVRRGDIPNIGLGRSVRIPLGWLERHLADHGAGPDIDRAHTFT